MGTEQTEGRVQHPSIELIVELHRAFNERRMDDVEQLLHDDVDLFLPVALRLQSSSDKGIAALKETLGNVLAIAPDVTLLLERAEALGDLVILACVVAATGTDGKRYEWPVRVIVAEDEGRISRYIVRAPDADIGADAHAFARARTDGAPVTAD